MRVSRSMAALCLSLLASFPLQAVESVEDEIVRTVTAMAKVGASDSATFSPDGKRIAFVSDLSGTRQVWALGQQGGWPDKVTSLDGNVANTHWSPDGRWIAFHFSAKTGGQQIYIVRPDGTDVRRVTDGGDESNFLDGWSPDSRHLMIASNRRDRKSIDAFLYDVERQEWKAVSTTPALEELVAVSPDGKRGLLYRQGGRGDNDVLLIDLDTLQETNLTPHAPPGVFRLAAFGPDGSTVYMTSDKDRELEGFARVRIDAQGRPQPLEIIASREGIALEQLALSPDGKTAALTWNVSGRSELTFLDLETLAVGSPIALPNDIAFQLRFSPDSSELSLLVIGSAAPPNIWIYNRPEGKFRQMTFSPHPGVDLSQVVRPELYTYRTHDGLAVSGWLYRPTGDRKQRRPLLVILHGGPDAMERPTFLGTYQELVQRGILVLGLNPRGSTGFGKSFTHLDNGALRINAVRDVKEAVDSLVSDGQADSSRVGVWGWSSGGLLALSAITDYPGTFKAGALLSGLIDLPGFFEKTEPWIASISKAEYGDPQQNAAELQALSPARKIDTVSVPLLVIHGVLDTNVPIEQADRLVENLEKRKVPVQYLRFPDERHGVAELPNRIRYSVEVVKWFDKYLTSDQQAQSRIESPEGLASTLCTLAKVSASTSGCQLPGMSMSQRGTTRRPR